MNTLKKLADRAQTLLDQYDNAETSPVEAAWSVSDGLLDLAKEIVSIFKTSIPEKPPAVHADDFEPFSECDQPLNYEQIQAVIMMSYFRACLMAKEFGSDWDEKMEAAFLNGVMSTFFACKRSDRIPAWWVFGRSRILDVLAKHKAEGRLFPKER